MTSLNNLSGELSVWPKCDLRDREYEAPLVKLNIAFCVSGIIGRKAFMLIDDLREGELWQPLHDRIRIRSEIADGAGVGEKVLGKAIKYANCTR